MVVSFWIYLLVFILFIFSFQVTYLDKFKLLAWYALVLLMEFSYQGFSVMLHLFGFWYIPCFFSLFKSLTYILVILSWLEIIFVWFKIQFCFWIKICGLVLLLWNIGLCLCYGMQLLPQNWIEVFGISKTCIMDFIFLNISVKIYLYMVSVMIIGIL